MNKRVSTLALVLIAVLVLTISGCAKKETASSQVTVSAEPATSKAVQYADGAYFAIEDAFDDAGWKDYVSLTVSGGKISAVTWSAINRAGDEKVAYDQAGKYNMVKFGQAKAEWWEQAADVEQYLLANQRPGTVDEIGSVSITVSGFTSLVEKALKAGVVTTGAYTDGIYRSEASSFDSGGWKTHATLLVHDGNIVSAYYSGVNKDGQDKQLVAAQGGYGMARASAIGKEWDEQAKAVEAHLLATQDPKKVNLKDDGSTDDISGASMAVADFFTLVTEALSQGPNR
ncbi:MAG TPA: hypothetical protein VFC80_03320 [Sphaerochaeta sp.]|nr:hypothetical protein [Sphaerochaeta sp.]